MSGYHCEKPMVSLRYGISRALPSKSRAPPELPLVALSQCHCCVVFKCLETKLWSHAEAFDVANHRGPQTPKQYKDHNKVFRGRKLCFAIFIIC